MTRLRFSLAQHPFDRWLFDRIELARRAEHAAEEELTRRTREPEFRALAHAFVKAVVAPHLPFVPFVQRGAYVRMHLPGEREGTAFHSDLGLGHGPEEQNVWIALSPATLHLVPLEEELPIDEAFQARARALAVPVTLEPGEALLFPSRQVHGVPPHRGARPQITIDLRVAPRINEHAIMGCPFEALGSSA